MSEGEGKGTFVKHVGLTLAVQGLSVLLWIGASGIVARWLGAEVKGLLALGMLVMVITQMVLGMGLGLAATYFVGSKKLTADEVAGNSVGFSLLTALSGFALVGLLQVTGVVGMVMPNLPTWILWGTMLGLPAAMVAAALRAVLLGLQEIALVNAVNLMQAAGTFVLTVVFVLLVPLGTAGALAAMVAGQYLSFLASWWMLARRSVRCSPRFEKEIVVRLVVFGIKGAVGNLLQFFNYRLDVFLVNGYLGAGPVGIYTVSARLAELLWNLPSAVSFVIFPRAAASESKAMNRFTPRVVAATLALTGVGGLILAAVGPWFIRLVYSDKFMGAYAPMLVLLPGVVLVGGARVLVSEIAGRGHPIYNSINAGLALVLTVVGDIILIPRMGIMGAAVASTISYGAVFFVALLFYAKVKRESA